MKYLCLVYSDEALLHSLPDSPKTRNATLTPKPFTAVAVCSPPKRWSR